jgi:uracil-DNA glycosylase
MTDCDPGYPEPYLTLCRSCPDTTVYPSSDFRTEWGPVFHRGRLDGTARVLAIGQDPAQSENIARRILVGTAGHRFQGFLKKLGVTRSYVLINTFVYSVYGQQGGTAHMHDPGIIAYRHSWLGAIFANNSIEAVIALGSLADEAWTTWRATAAGQQVSPAYQHITHPTQPESASQHDAAKAAQLTKQMLKNWNTALTALHSAIAHPDTVTPLTLYGDSFQAQELVEIPEADVPPGTPPWMRIGADWAARTDSGTAPKRAAILVTVPPAFRP